MTKLLLSHREISSRLFKNFISRNPLDVVRFCASHAHPRCCVWVTIVVIVVDSTASDGSNWDEDKEDAQQENHKTHMNIFNKSLIFDFNYVNI